MWSAIDNSNKFIKSNKKITKKLYKDDNDFTYCTWWQKNKKLTVNKLNKKKTKISILGSGRL